MQMATATTRLCWRAVPWETTEDTPSRDLAIEQRVGAFDSRKLFLDGQQRLTSLTAVLRGEPLKFKNRVRPVEIAFNLDYPGYMQMETVKRRYRGQYPRRLRRQAHDG